MSNQSKTLIYFVGGLSDITAPKEHPFHELYERFKEENKEKGWEIKIHKYRQSSCFSFTKEKEFIVDNPCETSIPLFTDQSAEDLATQLDLEIERKSRKHDAKNITIIAYSSGSALVRRALLQAKDREWRLRDEPAQKCWSNLLNKVIHIGGITVGWEFNSQMPKHYLWIGPIIRPLCPLWFIWQIYRGSKFITDTRIGLNRHHLPQTHNIFYLLGTKDQFLSPGDAIEPGSIQGNGNDPIYLEINDCDHNSILGKAELKEILNTISKNNTSSVKITNEIIQAGHAKYIPQMDIDDYLDPMDNEPARKAESVKHVVVILHGIRDSGFWAKRIAHRIKQQYRMTMEQKVHGDEEITAVINNMDQTRKAASELRVISLSYGYFSLWDFLRPGGRRQAIEWFQNVYADVTALYPNSEVSFIGHSNGTYLGTHSLQCEKVTYRYMVLAGSVVRRDFWDTKGKDWDWGRKVRRLMNIQGVDDWIVGLLPGGLEAIPIFGKWMDLGGLGAYGNRWLKEPDEQIKIVGDHGAGIIDSGWDKLASFILHQDVFNAPSLGSDTPPFENLSTKNPKRQKQLLLNRLMYLARPLGGLYIYLAIFICFSPIIQLVWTAIIPHLNLSSTHSDQAEMYRWLALCLLIPLGILALLLLIGNAITSLIETAKALIQSSKPIDTGKESAKTREKLRKSFMAVIILPAIAFLVTNIIVFLLQGPELVMALLIILSVFSFSLLKRI